MLASYSCMCYAILWDINFTYIRMMHNNMFNIMFNINCEIRIKIRAYTCTKYCNYIYYIDHYVRVYSVLAWLFDHIASYLNVVQLFECLHCNMNWLFSLIYYHSQHYTS